MAASWEVVVVVCWYYGMGQIGFVGDGDQVRWWRGGGGSNSRRGEGAESRLGSGLEGQGTINDIGVGYASFERGLLGKFPLPLRFSLRFRALAAIVLSTAQKRCPASSRVHP